MIFSLNGLLSVLVVFIAFKTIDVVTVNAGVVDASDVADIVYCFKQPPLHVRFFFSLKVENKLKLCIRRLSFRGPVNRLPYE